MPTPRTDMDRRTAAARIREMDRTLAPGSETELLGEALDSLRRATDVAEDLAWWEGAYRMYEWAMAMGAVPHAVEILHSGEDLTDWQPGWSYRRLREEVGWSQATAADMLDVDVMTISRRERGVTEIDREAWLALTRLVECLTE